MVPQHLVLRGNRTSESNKHGFESHPVSYWVIVGKLFNVLRYGLFHRPYKHHLSHKDCEMAIMLLCVKHLAQPEEPSKH